MMKVQEALKIYNNLKGSKKANEINIILAQNKIEYKTVNDLIEYVFKIIKNCSLAKENILLLPELWVSGFTKGRMFYFAKHHQKLIRALQKLCVDFKTCLTGTFPQFTDLQKKKLYNSFIFISQEGKILSTYNKIHLFPSTQEQEYFLKGLNPVILNLNYSKIGFAICYDIRFPELFRYYALNGVELILISACFPEPKLNDWRVLLQARAIENQLFIAAVNASGKESICNHEIVYFGHSMIINPKGQILVELQENEIEKSVKINLLEVEKTRANINYLNSITTIS